MLRISELSTDLGDKVSRPISINDLMRNLPVENHMKFGIVEQYFKLLSDDQVKSYERFILDPKMMPLPLTH